MRKDVKKEERISPSGYHYFVRNKFVKKPVMAVQSFEKQPSKERLNNLGQFFLKGFKNLPRTLFKTLRYVMMTPIMIVLFVLNIVKSIFGIFISWIIFKGILSIVCVAVIAIHSELTNTYVGYNSFSDITFIHWLFPNSVITYWWEWAMLIIFTLMTAYTLTFTPRRIELESY